MGDKIIGVHKVSAIKEKQKLTHDITNVHI